MNGARTSHHLRWAIVALGASALVVVSTAAWAAGGFSNPHFIHPSGTRQFPVAVADLNRDGRQDIVVGSEDNKTISIMYGKKGGGFKAPDDHPAGNYPFWISIADFNHDRRPDIAVGSYVSPGTVTVLLANKSGFRSPDTYTVGGDSLFSMAVADFNGDGNKDIVTVNYDSNNFSILLGRRNGTFKHGVTQKVGNLPVSVVASDLNHDHKVDLAVLSYGSGRGFVQVLFGKGNGKFKRPRKFKAGASTPDGMVAGRLVGDGSLDLAVLDCEASPNKVYILEGTGKGTFKKPRGFKNDPGSCEYQGSVADLNRDGRQDIVMGVAQGSHIGDADVLYGKKGDKFSAPKLFPATGPDDNYSVAVGRFNSDRWLDLAIPDLSSPRTAVLYGKG